MKLTSFEVDGRKSYGIVSNGRVSDLGAKLGEECPDLKSLIAAGIDVKSLADVQSATADYAVDDISFLPVIPNPSKIICVGLNYVEHREETNNAPTEHPALFVRLAESQVGHRQPLLLPPETSRFDYEGEIAVIVSRSGRRISAADAWDYVAGYACYNDGSVRDWQRHTGQWTAGKNFMGTGGFGPWMVTSDEIPGGAEMTLVTRLNGREMQRATTDMMIHSIPSLIAYISTFTRLDAGDVIVSGTPGGVGARRDPPVFMNEGDTVEIEIDRVGTLVNRVVAG